MMTKERSALALDVITLIALPFIVFNAYLRFGIPLEALMGDSLRVWSGNGTPVFDFVRALTTGQGIPAWSESFSRPHFNLTSELAPLFQTLIQFFTQNIATTIKIDTLIHVSIGSLGIYFLSLSLFRDRLSAWLGAILYAFMPFNVAYLQAEMGRAWGPMLAPFAYLALFHLIWKPTLGRAFLAALLAAR